MRTVARWLFASSFIIALSIIFWRQMSSVPAKLQEPPSSPVIKMYHHFVDQGSNLNQPNTPMDACGLLISCFGENDRYSVYGEHHCAANLALTLQYYDSAYLVEEDGDRKKAVGFISIHHQRSNELDRRPPSASGDQHALIVYNVCVHPEYRGRGLGKRLVPEFVAAMIEHYGLEPQARSRGGPGEPPPLVIALDVELDTPNSQEAFTIYAKQGFLRWLQPCRSVAELDWRIVNQTAGKAHPFGLLLSSDRERYLREAYRVSQEGYIHKGSLVRGPDRDGQGRIKREQPKQPRLVNHLCMYKYHSDGFAQMASDYLRFIQQAQPEPPK